MDGDWKPKRRTEMTIIAETKKALKIEVDGVQAWIQRRWLRADGTLTAAGEKALAEAAEPKVTGIVVSHVIRETEKAVCIEVEYDLTNIEKNVTRSMWIPKSLISDDVIPVWFVNKKLDEIELALVGTGAMLVTRFETVCE